MFKRFGLVVLVLAAAANAAHAQDQQAFDKIFLGSSGCALQSGAGDPNGSVIGSVCDWYIRTSSGEVYRKLTGTASNTGWVGPSALTKTDDTNVTLTLGGSASTALLNPASLTLGWSGQLSPARGGTGLGSYAVGDLIYASGSGTLSRLADVAVNRVLVSGGVGVAPAWSATPTVTSLATTSTITVGTDANPLTGYLSNLGSLSNKYLTVHAAELWVETLVAQNTIATIGGRVLVAPTNILSADLASGGTTMTVKYNNFNNGDRVYMEANGKVEWFAVTSGAGGSAGAYTYSVTRNLDGSGADNWFAGDAVLDTGTTGNGFIDLYSTAGVLSGTGPSIVGNVRTGSTYSNLSPRWAVGNLTGLYGYTSTTCASSLPCYGFAAGDASGANVVIDPDSGIRFRQGTTTYAQMASSIFRVGAAGGKRVEWDNSTLTVVSDFVTIDANGITMPISGSSSATATNAYRFTTTTGTLGMFAFSPAAGATGLSLRNVVTSGADQGASTYLAAQGWKSGASRTASYVTADSRTNTTPQLDLGSTLVTVTLYDAASSPSFSVFGSAGGNALFNVDNVGVTTHRSTSSLMSVWDSSHANGGWLVIEKSGTPETYLGASVAISGVGASTDTDLYAAGNLYLHGAGGSIFARQPVYGASSGGFSFYSDTDTGMDNDAANRIRWSAGGVHIFWDGTQFFPETDGGRNLGAPSFRWGTVYAAVGVINTSDQRQKKSIRDTGKAVDFLLALRPVDYEWQNQTLAPGLHSGFLAQQVALADPTFGGVFRDASGEAVGLNYAEFTAPIVAGFQNHEGRLKALELQVQGLKDELAALKKKAGGQ